MKKILGIIVVGLLLSVNAYADDIKDFQIEGMSVGDSLLDYMTLNEIKKAKKDKDNIYYNNKSFVSIMSSTKIYNNLKVFDDVYFTLKTKDKEFIIYAIEGKIMIKDNKKNTCYNEQKIIANDIQKAFPSLNLNMNKFDVKKSDLKNKDKSVKYIDMKLPLSSLGGEFRVSCHEEKGSKGKVRLFVIINSAAFAKALGNN